MEVKNKLWKIAALLYLVWVQSRVMRLINPPLLGNRTSLDVATVSFSLRVQKTGVKRIKRSTVRGDDRSEYTGLRRMR